MFSNNGSFFRDTIGLSRGGLKQCSTRYLSCLSTSGKIKTTYINNIVGNLKNDQEPRLTDLVSHQLLANHVVGNHLQYQLDTAGSINFTRVTPY
jgi:hypothetical protein